MRQAAAENRKKPLISMSSRNMVLPERFVLNRMTLPEQVAQKIESMILIDEPSLAGKLPSEQSLALSFSVSRSVIREALVILRAKGLIEKTNGTTAKVCRQPSVNLENTLKLMVRLQNIPPKDICEVRLALETLAVSLAAGRCTPEDIACLEEMADAVEKEKDDFTRRTELELEFHRKIAALSGNTLLATLADALFSQLTPMIREVLDKIGVTTDAGVLHRNIVRALRDANADEAAEQMRIHMALFIRNFETRK